MHFNTTCILTQLVSVHGSQQHSAIVFSPLAYQFLINTLGAPAETPRVYVSIPVVE